MDCTNAVRLDHAGKVWQRKVLQDLQDETNFSATELEVLLQVCKPRRRIQLTEHGWLCACRTAPVAWVQHAAPNVSLACPQHFTECQSSDDRLDRTTFFKSLGNGVWLYLRVRTKRSPCSVGLALPCLLVIGRQPKGSRPPRAVLLSACSCQHDHSA